MARREAARKAKKLREEMCSHEAICVPFQAKSKNFMKSFLSYVRENLVCDFSLALYTMQFFFGEYQCTRDTHAHTHIKFRNKNTASETV